MATGLTFKINRKDFDRIHKEYLRYSRRTLADSINTKLFFIGRGAIRETPKASVQQIRTEFGQAVLLRYSKKTGKTIKSNSRSIFGAMIGDIPRLAVIINARRKKRGKPPLLGRELEQAMNIVFNARIRSVAFLKSGWLPAVGTLDVITADKRGAPPREANVKRYGAAKGGARPANPSFWKTSGAIWNTADTKRDNKQALIKYGEPALQRAFDAEIKSMDQYIGKKLGDRARALGIKTK